MHLAHVCHRSRLDSCGYAGRPAAWAGCMAHVGRPDANMAHAPIRAAPPRPLTERTLAQLQLGTRSLHSRRQGFVRGAPTGHDGRPILENHCHLPLLRNRYCLPQPLPLLLAAAAPTIAGGRQKGPEEAAGRQAAGRRLVHSAQADVIAPVYEMSEVGALLARNL